jgi:hypothetical protein
MTSATVGFSLRLTWGTAVGWTASFTVGLRGAFGRVTGATIGWGLCWTGDIGLAFDGAVVWGVTALFFWDGGLFWTSDFFWTEAALSFFTGW